MPGLYVHIPFCVSKCYYCDFYSVAGETELLDRYLEALFREAEKYSDMRFETLYIGGGTPSILGPDRLEMLMHGLSQRLNLNTLGEASIEVNPESACKEFFKAALSLGINRVSIGVQSLNDRELKNAGRIHNAGIAVDAVYAARDSGFKNISADIIIGLPGQTRETLFSTLNQLCCLPLSHISAYCLSIEEHTVFGVNKPADLADDDTQAGLFEDAALFLIRKGFKHYEISNFSLTEKECSHNLNYWRGGEYIGLGPAAASHIEGKRFKNKNSLQEYLQCSEAVVSEEESLVKEDKMTEEAMLRLRLLEEGLDLVDLEGRYAGVNVGLLRDRLDRLLQEKMLEKTGHIYKLPSDRVLVSNQVFMNMLG
ncbi:MAG: radical SAM family heme chaperone HemW [Dehalococcoidia bacterium]|nr:radical SAM family heme chaperone HemW [Dehalococcoidia bacterium]